MVVTNSSSKVTRFPDGKQILITFVDTRLAVNECMYECLDQISEPSAVAVHCHGGRYHCGNKCYDKP